MQTAIRITPGHRMVNGSPSIQQEGRYTNSEVALMKADGTGERINLTQSGFFDGGAQWALGGKALLWVTDRDGKRPLALQGAREVDVYAMFFDQDTYDRLQIEQG